jgi:hypothetical protein
MYAWDDVPKIKGELRPGAGRRDKSNRGPVGLSSGHVGRLPDFSRSGLSQLEVDLVVSVLATKFSDRPRWPMPPQPLLMSGERGKCGESKGQESGRDESRQSARKSKKDAEGNRSKDQGTRRKKLKPGLY